jgi:hypothetical protein
VSAVSNPAPSPPPRQEREPEAQQVGNLQQADDADDFQEALAPRPGLVVPHQASNDGEQERRRDESRDLERHGEAHASGNDDESYRDGHHSCLRCVEQMPTRTSICKRLQKPGRAMR